MTALPASLADPRACAVLEVLAQHAHVEAAQLQADLRAQDLGMSELEMALALFDIEDRFDVRLAPTSGFPQATVGQLVQQVLQRR